MLFALANAGVSVSADVWNGHEPLMLAIATGLVIGKPLGLVSASVLAVWLAVFAASILSASIGVAVLWSTRRDEPAAGAGPS